MKTSRTYLFWSLSWLVAVAAWPGPVMACPSSPTSWLTGTSGNWSDPAKWSGSCSPVTAADSVKIDVPGTYTVTVNVDWALGSLQIDSPNAKVTASGRALQILGIEGAPIPPILIAGELELLSGASLTGPAPITVGGGLLDLRSVSVVAPALRLEGGLATVSNGSTFKLGHAAGTELVANAPFQLNGGLSFTSIELQGDAILSGANAIVMSNSSTNRILHSPTAAGFLLRNAGTIRGGGQIGAGISTIENLGTIEIDSTAGLTLDPGPGNAINAGILAARPNGILRLTNGVFANSGLITVDAGGECVVTSAAVEGGSIQIAGPDGELRLQSGRLASVVVQGDAGGLVRVTSSTGNELEDVTIGVPVTHPNGVNATFRGQVELESIYSVESSTQFSQVAIGGEVVLSGSGALHLTGSSANRVIAGESPAKLTLFGGSITGGGSLGTGGVEIVNQGAIVANLATRTLTVQTSPAGVTNTGILAAESGGTLELLNSVVTHDGPPISAGAGSVVELDNAVVFGGSIQSNGDAALIRLRSATVDGAELDASGGGTVQFSSGTSLLHDAGLSGVVQQLNGATVHVSGTLTNAGSYSLASTTQLTNLRFVGPVVLEGGGELVLTATATTARHLDSVDVLDNVDTVIRGRGPLGQGMTTFVNRGEIRADSNGATLHLQPSSAGILNEGLLSATGGGRLEVLLATADNANGAIEAAASSVVELDQCTVTGGRIAATGAGGTIELRDTDVIGASIEGGNAGLVRIFLLCTLSDTTLDMPIDIESGGHLTVAGDLVTARAVRLLQGSSSSSLRLPSGAFLTGGGELDLGLGSSQLLCTTAGGTLTIGDFVVRGRGTLGDGTTSWVNQGAIVSDSGAGSLQVSMTSGGQLLNQGLLAAIGAGSGERLRIIGGSFTNAGTIHVGAGLTLRSTVDLVQTQGVTRVDGTLSLTTSTTGDRALILEGGVLAGDGAVQATVTNGGIVAPGVGIGSLSIQKPFTQTVGGTLEVELGGPPGSQAFDTLAVTGKLTMAGTLRVAFVDGFVPQAGDVYSIATATSFAGAFAAIEGPGSFSAVVNQGALELHVLAVASPCDVPCTDGSACTDDRCTLALGCVHVPTSCTDGDPCTCDSCDEQQGCVHVPVPCAVSSCGTPSEQGSISDLTAAPGSAHGEVALGWTAPVDATTGGPVSSYDVRYHVSPLQEADWASYPALAPPVAPSLPGQLEQAIIGGLDAGVTYFFAVRAFDQAGALGPLSNVAASVPLDLEPPLVTLVEPTDLAHVGGTITVRATPSDPSGIARVEYTLDGAFVGIATVAPFFVLLDTTAHAEGLHTLVATAFDALENTAFDAHTITIDNTPPTLSITPPLTPSGQPLTLEVSVSDNLTPPGEISLENHLGQSPPFIYGAEGTHAPAITATDLAGNQAVATTSFVLDFTGPSAIGDLAASSNAGTEVALDWTAPADALTTVASYALFSAPAAKRLAGAGTEVLHVYLDPHVLPAATAAVISPALAGDSSLMVSSSTGFAPGQEVMLLVVQGDEAGRYQLARIAEVEPGVLHVEEPLLVDLPGATSRVTVTELPSFSEVVVHPGGRLVPPAWNGIAGGVLALRAGSIDIRPGGSVSADGVGFRGGSGLPASCAKNAPGAAGEGEHFGPPSDAPAAHGMGGGGGHHACCPSSKPGGGGGGHASQGAPGGSASALSGGQGGATAGTPTLERLLFGGGGGQGAADNDGGFAGAGGAGGGVLWIAAEHISNRGLLSVNGAQGGNACNICNGCSGNGCGMGGGGGGAGGSMHVMATTYAGNLGVLQATGGPAGSNNGCGGHGGAGADGRIRVDAHVVALGATSPSPLVQGEAALLEVLEPVLGALPLPGAPGSPEHVSLPLEPAGATRAFVLRGLDAVGNLSSPSNVAYVDDTPPVVAWTQPTAGATVRRPMLLSASASDDAGVESVEFRIGSQVLGSDATPPFEIPWDPRLGSAGLHTLRATATDSSGNESTAELMVQVSTDLPQIAEIDAPLDGSIVSAEEVTVSGTAEADTTASIYVGGALEASVPVTRAFPVALPAAHSTAVGTGTVSSGTSATLAPGALLGTWTFPSVSLPEALWAGVVAVHGAAHGGELTAEVRVRQHVLADSFESPPTTPIWLVQGDAPIAGGVRLQGDGAAWGSAQLAHNALLAREGEPRFRAVVVPVAGGGVRQAIVGFQNSAVADPFAAMAHGLFLNGSTLQVVEGGAVVQSLGPLAAGAQIALEVELRPGAGAFYRVGSPGGELATLHATSTGSVSSLHSAVTLRGGQFEVLDALITEAAWRPPSHLAEPDADLSVLGFRAILARASAEAASPVVESLDLLWTDGEPGVGLGMWRATGVPLAEGPQLITAVASDEVGAAPASAPHLVTRDTGPPAPPTNLVATPLPAGAILLTWSVPVGDGVAEYQLLRADGPDAEVSAMQLVATTTSTGIAHTPPADGAYSFAVIAVDSLGNASAPSATVHSTSDRIAPKLAASLEPASPLGVGGVTVHVTSSEMLQSPPELSWKRLPSGPALAVPLAPKEGEPLSWAGTFEVKTSTPSGSYTLAWSGKDVAGNTGTTFTSTAIFTIDTSPPTANLTVAPTAPLGPGDHVVVLTANELLGAVPLLAFTPAGGAAVPIALAGSGATFSGLLTIDGATPNGVGVFSATLVDVLGNTGQGLSSGGTTLVDTVPPSAPTGLTGSPLALGTVQLTWNPLPGEPGAIYRVYRSLGPIVTPGDATLVAAAVAGVSIIDAPPDEATWTYAVSAVDLAGNEGPLSANTSVSADDTPPPPPTNLSAQLVGNQIALTWNAPSAEAITSYRVFRQTQAPDGSFGPPGLIANAAGLSAVDQPLADGIYAYTVRALDAAQNQSVPSEPATIVYDAAAPTITITGTSQGQVHGTFIAVHVAISDASLVSSSILLNGAPYASGSPIDADGSYTLQVAATDSAGRKSTKSVSFAIDTQPPSLALSGVSDGAVYHQVVHPTYTASDPHLASLTATLNGQSFASGAPVAVDGNYALLVTAKDKANNTSTLSVAFSVDLPPSPPPLLLVTADLDSGVLAAQWAPSSAADVVEYRVFRDGDVIATTTGLEANAGAVPEALFRTAIEVSAVDGTGQESPRTQALLRPLDLDCSQVGHAGELGEPTTTRGYFDRVTLLAMSLDVEDIEPAGVRLALNPAEEPAPWAVELAEAATLELLVPTSLEHAMFTPVDTPSAATLRCGLVVAAGPYAEVQWVREVELTTTSPDGPPLEVVHQGIVAGAQGHAALRVYNRGTAELQLHTGASGSPSPDLFLALSDVGGATVDSQAVLDASPPTAAGVHLATLVPGAQYTSPPVDLLVPSAVGATVRLEAYVHAAYNQFGTVNEQQGPSFAVSTVTTTIPPPYFASASTDAFFYDAGKIVAITGAATDSATGAPVPNATVKIAVSRAGFTQTFLRKTKADGTYLLSYLPLPGKAGLYSVSATHPDVVSAEEDATFNVLGFNLQPEAVKVTLAEGTSFAATFSLSNTGDTAIDGIALAYEDDDPADGVTFVTSVAPPSSVAPQEKATMRILVSAAPGTLADGTLALKLTTGQGITRVGALNYVVVASQPGGTITPPSRLFSLASGQAETADFLLANPGTATWLNLHASFQSGPDWLTFTTPPSLGNLAPGETRTLGVLAAPPENHPNGVVHAILHISSANLPPRLVPISVSVTSSLVGHVQFEVRNAVFLGFPPVEGAKVVLQSQQSAGLVFKGATDQDGLATFESIPAGLYSYNASKLGFQGKSTGLPNELGSVLVLPGQTAEVVVDMFELPVSVEWTVEPTTFQDEYDIVLSATYETSVPAPILIVTPQHQVADEDAEVEITNAGTTDAIDVTIEPAEAADDDLSAEPAVEEIPKIGPGESVVIPVKIKKPKQKVGVCGETITTSIRVGYSWICETQAKVPMPPQFASFTEASSNVSAALSQKVIAKKVSSGCASTSDGEEQEPDEPNPVVTLTNSDSSPIGVCGQDDLGFGASCIQPGETATALLPSLEFGDSASIPLTVGLRKGCGESAEPCCPFTTVATKVNVSCGNGKLVVQSQGTLPKFGTSGSGLSGFGSGGGGFGFSVSAGSICGDSGGGLANPRKKPKRNPNEEGEPVVLSSGEFTRSFEYLKSRGRGNLDYSFHVNYASGMEYDGPCGHGWMHNFDRVIEFDDQGNLRYQDGFGRVETFLDDSASPGGFVSPEGVYAIARFDAGTGDVVIRDPHGTREIFDAATGKLTRIVDRFGNEMVFQYDSTGKLVLVEEPLGRLVTYEYNAAKRLVKVRDFADRTVKLEYDAQGNLVKLTGPSVTGTPNGNDFPSGKSHVFTYSSAIDDVALSHNMLTITNPNEASGVPLGPPVLVNVYDSSDRVVEQVWGGVNEAGVPAGGVYSYAYEELVDPFDVEFPLDPNDLVTPVQRASVIDPNGNLEEHYHNQRGHRVLLREYTNRNLRPNDPEFFETRCEYNADGERTREILPQGNTIEFEYDTASPLRSNHGNLVKRRRIPDAARGGAQPFIESRWVYDPVFNQTVKTIDARKLSVANLSTAFVPFMGELVTVAIIDYQEGTSLTALAAEAETDTATLDSLLAARGIQLGLGDVNGDGTTSQAAGLALELRLPQVTLPSGSTQDIEGTGRQTVAAQYAFNERGQILESVDAEGYVTVWTYYAENDPDGDGQLSFGVTSTKPMGYVKETIEDAKPHPKRLDASPPLQRNTRVWHDPFGNTTAHRDGRGVLTRYHVNALGQVVEHTRAASVDDVPLMAGGEAGSTESLAGQDYGYRTRYFYDANDNLIGEHHENRDGNTPDGGLAPGWFETHHRYDIRDNRIETEVELSDSGTAVWRWGYDPNTNRIATVLPEGNIVTEGYDERDLLMYTTRGDGNSNPYDAPPSGASQSDVFVDLNGNVQVLLDAEDNDGDGSRDALVLTYDGFDRVVEQRDAVGTQRKFTYDAVSNRTRIETWGRIGGPSPIGGGTAGNVLLAAQQVHYDELSRVERIDVAAFLADGVTTSHGAALQEGALSPGDGNVSVRFEYDRASRWRTVVRDNLDSYSFEYDGLYRLVRSEDALGNERSYGYDQADNRVRIEDVETSTLPGVEDQSFVGVTRFDSLGRIVAKIDNVGQTTRFSYDSRDLVVETSDARAALISESEQTTSLVVLNGPGNRRRLSYDGLGRLVVTETELREGAHGHESLDFTNPSNPDGIIRIQQQWDGNSRLVALVDDQGRQTQFHYDNLNRLIQETLSDSSVRTYAYDRDGNAVLAVDENGTRVSSVFDGANRLVQRAVDRAEDAGVVGTTAQSYQYDGLGRLVFCSDDNRPEDPNDDAIVHYRWDSMSRIVEEVQNGRSIGSHWASAKQRTGLVYPNGRTLELTYDALDRLASVGDSAASVAAGLVPATADGAPLARFDYIGQRISQLRYGNSTAVSMLDDTGHQASGYDAAMRLVRLRHLGPQGEVLADFQQTFDRDNVLEGEIRHHMPEGRSADRFAYDSSHRLVKAARGLPLADALDVDAATAQVRKSFELDGSGNWRKVTTQHVGESAVVDEPEVTLSHAYSVFEGQARVHDAAGNLRDDGEFLYQYDFLNRLVQVVRKADNALVARYTYDCRSRRTSRLAVLEGEGLVEERYFYDGLHVIEEQTPQGDTVRQYVYAPGLDRPLAFDRKSPLAAGAGLDEVFYYHTDAKGWVVALSSSSGELVERYTYDAFGAVRFEAPDSTPSLDQKVSAFGNPHLYASRRFDPETGLYDMRHRHYDPRTGRFLQRDAAGIFTDGMNYGNPYVYAGNSPLSYGDPLGLFTDRIDFLLGFIYGLGAGIIESIEGMWDLLKSAITDPIGLGMAVVQGLGELIDALTSLDFQRVLGALLPADLVRQLSRFDCLTPFEQGQVLGRIAGLLIADGLLGGAAFAGALKAGKLALNGMRKIIDGLADSLKARAPCGRSCGVRANGPDGSASGCFVAGTPVLTPGGEIPIEEAQPGDLVLAADTESLPGDWLWLSVETEEPLAFEGESEAAKAWERELAQALWGALMGGEP